MANRTVHPITTPKNEVQLITAKLVGAGAAAMTNGESSNLGGGEVASISRSGAGTFALTFRHSYPQLKGGCEPLVVGTTAGLRGRFSAIDVTAKTATLVMEVGAVATDPATTDTVYLALFVRNTNANS